MNSIQTIAGMIVVLLLVYIVCKQIMKFRKRKAFERVEIDGAPFGMGTLLADVAEDVGLPSAVTACITPYIYESSLEIRRAISRKDMPHEAIIAYFAAGALRGIAKANPSGIDGTDASDLLEYAAQCKAYAKKCRSSEE